MAEPRWLNQDEDRAWRGWLTMSSLLRAQVARDLQSECGLSDSDFAVLVHLSEAPGGRQRMNELAGALGWSKSRVSHQCSRMAVRGLVGREGCPEDARSAYATLTASGRAEIERAAPRHVESVRRHLIDLLDPEELGALRQISAKVIGHLSEVGLPCETEVGSLVALPPCPTRHRSAGNPSAGAGSSGDGSTDDDPAPAFNR
jgi:DNA-binding MarR family transcriptional regulator